MFMKILSLAIFFLGVAAFYAAKFIAKWLNLADKQKIRYEEEFSPEEIEELKERGAIIKAKLFSLGLLLPGIILILIYFK